MSKKNPNQYEIDRFNTMNFNQRIRPLKEITEELEWRVRKIQAEKTLYGYVIDEILNTLVEVEEEVKKYDATVNSIFIEIRNKIIGEINIKQDQYEKIKERIIKEHGNDEVETPTT